MGIFSLEIEPAKKGIAEIEIFFDIDASGILSVTAKDNINNKERSMMLRRYQKKKSNVWFEMQIEMQLRIKKN